MSALQDGGFLALSGFLYQLIGSAGHAIQVFESVSDVDTTKTETVFLLESYGQDAGAISVDEQGQRRVRLYQYKFSNEPTNNSITPSELKDIVETFDKSCTAVAEATGVAPHCVLVTNRPKSPEVGAAHGKAGFKLSPKRTETAALLAKFEWKHRVEAELLSVIKQRAESLGVTADEFLGRVRCLVSHFFVENICKGKRTIREHDIDQQLTGFDEPHILSSTAVREKMSVDLNKFKIAQQAPKPIQRRTIEQQISQAYNHSLIVLYGEGGNGKTMAICNYLESSLQCKRFVAAGRALAIKEHWISQVVAHWRNDLRSPHQADALEKALCRLVVSNTVERPVACFAIDAIDEVGDVPDRTATYELIRYFANRESCSMDSEKPEIVLIVTCRKPETVNTYLEYGGLSFDRQWGEQIAVGEFEDADVLSMLQTDAPPFGQSVIERLSEEAQSRLQSSADIPENLSQAIGSRSSFAVDIPTAFNPTQREHKPVEEGIYKALKHPIIWRCFADCHINETQGYQLLDNQGTGLAALCEEVIQWFCKKATLRQVVSQSAIARTTLIAAAKSLNQDSTVDIAIIGDRQSQWIDPARAEGNSTSDASRLFDEALSSGLIEIPSQGKWHWKHKFLRDHLPTLQF